MVTAALLLMIVIVAVVVRLGELIDTKEWAPRYLVAITILLVVLPIIVYVGVRYWNRIEQSLYPDIDESWRGGMEALRSVGLSLDSLPLFVVLGNTALEDIFVDAMQAGHVDFRLARVPDVAGADPPLRWYVTDAAIYLFCRRVGALSGLVQSFVPERYIDHNTIPPTGAGRRRGAAQHAYVGTITPGSIPAAVVAEAPAWQPRVPERAPRLAADVNSGEQLRRMRYVFRLIRRARRPRCGLNGAITAFPFELESAGERELQALIDATRSDFQSIRETLNLRFPVTGLVVGMEKAKGFVEFIQSLEPEDVHRRLGAGFDVRRRATGERLHQLSDGICDKFESFVYAHFGRHEALWQPEINRKLYALLCRVRERLKPKLNIVLRKAFGEGTSQPFAGESRLANAAPAPVFFSGCYLAATGGNPDQQAFIKGVLHDKLVLEQGQVEWTVEARRQQLLFKIAVWMGWALLAACLIGVGMIVRERLAKQQALSTVGEMNVAVLHQIAGLDMDVFKSDRIVDERPVVVGFGFGQSADGIELEVKVDLPQAPGLGAGEQDELTLGGPTPIVGGLH